MEKLIKKAEILIEALPYMQKFSGKTVVIKYGGNAMVNEELKHSVMEDITLMKFIGLNPIVVHGGGPDISKALDEKGVKSNFVNGLRVTDEITMQTAQQVLVGHSFRRPCRQTPRGRHPPAAPAPSEAGHGCLCVLPRGRCR